MGVKILLAGLVLVMGLMFVDAIVDRIILVEDRVEKLEQWNPPWQ